MRVELYINILTAFLASLIDVGGEFIKFLLIMRQ